MDTSPQKLIDLATELVEAAERHDVSSWQLYKTAIYEAITGWPKEGFRWPMLIIDLSADPPQGRAVEGVTLGISFADQDAWNLSNYIQLNSDEQENVSVDQIISDSIAGCVDRLFADDATDSQAELLTLLRLFDHRHELSIHKALVAAAEVDQAVVIVLTIGEDRWKLSVCDGEGELDRQEQVC